MPQAPLCQPLLLGGIQEALLNLPDKAPRTGLGAVGRRQVKSRQRGAKDIG